MVGGGHDDVLVAGDDRPVQRAILWRAATDADVGAARGQEFQHELAVADLELDRNVGMGLAERAQERRQERLSGRVDGGDADGGTHLAGGTLSHAGAQVEQAERLDRVGQEGLAGRAQLHAAPVAFGQRHADLLAERGDGSGHRRLRDVQALGRRADGAVLGDRDERAQLGECHSHRLMNLPALPAGCP